MPKTSKIRPEIRLSHCSLPLMRVRNRAVNERMVAGLVSVSKNVEL